MPNNLKSFIEIDGIQFPVEYTDNGLVIMDYPRKELMEPVTNEKKIRIKEYTDYMLKLREKYKVKIKK